MRLSDKHIPLATALRPRSLNEIIGQEHLLGAGTKLRKLIESDRLVSIILFGPSGTGKTTIAEVIALTTKSQFVRINATQATIKDIRKHGEAAKEAGTHVVIFVDECLPYNTLITCRIDGDIRHIPIGLLVEGRIQCEVASYNHITDGLEWRKVTSWMVRAPRPMVEIIIDDGGIKKRLRCSAEHPIYTKNRGYVPADALMSNDEIVDLGKYDLKEIHNVGETLRKVSS